MYSIVYKIAANVYVNKHKATHFVLALRFYPTPGLSPQAKYLNMQKVSNTK